MENYLPLLQKSPLFASMEPQQITSVLHCVGAVVREAGAGEYILRAGDRTQAMGLLLSGSGVCRAGRSLGAAEHHGKDSPARHLRRAFCRNARRGLKCQRRRKRAFQSHVSEHPADYHRLLGDLPGSTRC